MSSIALIDEEGVFVRKLHFTTLPENFVVPEDHLVSWRVNLEHSLASSLSLPQEANFYLGKAWGTIEATVHTVFGHKSREYKLVVTVQGHNTADVMALRDRLLTMIREKGMWRPAGDFTPWWSKLFGQKAA